MINRCNELTSNKKIVLKENRREFIIENHSNFKINKVRVDGCYITDGSRCDYLVEIINSSSIERVFYIELKGKDIEHAIEQLENTLKYCKAIHKEFKRECYIVLSRFPSSGTSSQVLKKKFKNRNNIQLYIDSKVKRVTL